MRLEECISLCRKYHGRVVRIEDSTGTFHIGRIVGTDDEMVWIEPIRNYGNRFRLRNDIDDYGYYGRSYDDYSYDRGYVHDDYGEAVYGLALGFIVGIALAGLFFI
ncbi:MAG: hypothetical protein ACE3JP_04880 [Ectobacillus sp.]